MPIKYQNIVFLLMLSFLSAAHLNRPGVRLSSKAVRWVVEKNSSLCINGRTNVNHFTCNIDQYAESDTIVCLDYPLGPVRLSGALQLNIFSFNCHSRLITKDFRKTMKAENYPVLTIRFLSLESMPAWQNESELIKGWVEIELAGVVKKFELTYSFSKAPSGLIQLIGERSFSFSDFNLSPVKKLGGIIKINDAFDVNFQLMLQPLK